MHLDFSDIFTMKFYSCLMFISASSKDSTGALEEKIDFLRHHIRIESAVRDGARNVMRTMQALKSQDKRVLAEVTDCGPICLVCFSIIMPVI